MSVSAAAAYGFWQKPVGNTRQDLPAASAAGQEPTSGGGSATGSKAERSAVDSFMEYVSGTAEERMFKAFLARRHMSKDDYDALPQEERQKIEEEFRKELQDRATDGAPVGRSVDVVV